MGRLITKSDIPNPCWYFEDAYYSRDGGQDRYKYEWPSSSFPHQAAIQYEDLVDNKVKIEIRKWIELNINDTVISETIDKSYRVYCGDKEGPRPYDMWERSYEIDNRWLIFHFEDEHSAAAFRLRFGHLIKEIYDREPEHLDKITENRR